MLDPAAAVDIQSRGIEADERGVREAVTLRLLSGAANEPDADSVLGAAQHTYNMGGQQHWRLLLEAGACACGQLPTACPY